MERSTSYLELKIIIIENPDYKKPRTDLIDTNQGSQEPGELIQDTEDEEVEKKPTKKRYPHIKATIVNSSRNKNAANNLGFKLRREYGIRYAVVTSSKRYKNTVIYYNNPNQRTVAKEFADTFPGVQKCAPLPRSVKLTKYKDIVIFLGNDYKIVLDFKK